MDPSSDGPERLRAVSEYSEDLGPAIPPMDDMLPHMTPKKSVDVHSDVPTPPVDRHDSAINNPLLNASFRNNDQDEMIAADYEMDNLDLPPLMPRAEEEVGGSNTHVAAANTAIEAKTAAQAENENQGEATMDVEPHPAPPEDPPPEAPEDFPDLPAEDVPMNDVPAMNPGVSTYSLLVSTVSVQWLACIGGIPLHGNELHAI
jgi:hypothetical protein